MHIVVIGAGAWGTAMACAAARPAGGHRVTLWARAPEQAQAMQSTRTNPRYLPDVVLPAGVSVVSGPLAAALPGADLLIIGTPMAGLRSTLHWNGQRNFAPRTRCCSGCCPSAVCRKDVPCTTPRFECIQDLHVRISAVSLDYPHQR